MEVLRLNMITSWFASIGERFALNFIKEDRWHYLVDGLGTTLLITFFALILGILLGSLVAMVRVTHDRTGKMKFLNAIAKLYLTVIRGTPVMVQLLLFYFGILQPLGVISSIRRYLLLSLYLVSTVALTLLKLSVRVFYLLIKVKWKQAVL